MNDYGYLAYTYYLYHVPTGKKYYGSRVANRCEPEQDLWNKYFSSSKIVKKLIKEYGKKSFQATVRKTFDTSEAAIYWEHEVIRRLKAPEKEDWLNQAYMYSGQYVVFWNDIQRKTASDLKIGSKNPMFGKYGVDAANFGKHRSEELKATDSKNKIEWWLEKRKNEPDYRKGKNHPRYGIIQTKDEIRKRYKSVRTPLGIFESVRAACRSPWMYSS